MTPIHTLPPDYEQVEHLVLTEPRRLVWLNLLSFVLLLPFLGAMIVWTALVVQVRGSGAEIDIVWWVGWLLVLLVFPLHELIHGLAIMHEGHKPRYGVQSFTIARVIKIPYVLYATADNALFLRNAFIMVALAPVVVITLLGMLLIALLPTSVGSYIAIAVILNGGGAIGDIWMTWVVLRYPPDALVKDEADSLRVFIQHESPT